MPAACAWRGCVKRDVLAVDLDRALVRRVHAGQGLHQRRLAGAVLADDRMDLAGLQVEVHTVEDLDADEALSYALHLQERHTDSQTSVLPAVRAAAASGTSTHDSVRADASTAAGDPRGPQPIFEERQPVGRLARDARRVGVGHERVEAVAVPLRVTGGKRGQAGGRGAEHRGVALEQRRVLAAADPQALRLLLVELERLLGGVDLEHQPVLAAGRDLADRRRCRPRRGRSRTGRSTASSVTRAGTDTYEPRRHARDPVAGHELGEVAPVRADVRERARGAAELTRRRASCRPRA